MKRLYIARHAKSGRDFLSIQDFDRVLTERGITDAHLIASQFVNDKRELPEIVYSSPANRALHTAVIFSKTVGYPIEKIVLNTNLYAASLQQLLSEIQKTDNRYNSLMIVGHNDGLTYLINELLKKTYIDNLPTAAMACLELEISLWKDIKNAQAELKFLYIPREFKKEI